MQVKAQLKNLRIAPRKVQLVAELIKGLEVNEAIAQLEATIKRGTDPVEKLLKSAIANAENNFGLDKDNLYIFDIQVGEGARLKRWMPRAYGRASQILKRTSHIYLTLDEVIEGKNRKSKEEMEKERKKREEARKKMEKEMREAQEKEEKALEKEEKYVEAKIAADKEDKKEENIKRDFNKGKGDGRGKKGWMSKVFQRKSM
jgi:large subunit ribosomal protein L22